VERKPQKEDVEMSKRKRGTRIVLAENHHHEPALPDFRVPTIENILHAGADEMDRIRDTLAQQQLELLNRRGYLASVIKQIDEHLEIINNTLRMIEANQR
jgi:hypothetical protein